MAPSSESPTDVDQARAPRRWYAIWFKAITRPTVGNFKDLLAEPDVSFRRALKWVVLASVMAGLLSFAIEPGFIRFDRASGWVNLSAGLDWSVSLVGIFTFVFYVFFEHALARALGGRGSYTQLAFLAAAYTAPLILISGVLSGVDYSIAASISSAQASAPAGLSFIGTTGSMTPGFAGARLLLFLVRFALDSIALRAVHQLSLSEALLPVLASMMLTGCAIGLLVLMSFG